MSSTSELFFLNFSSSTLEPNILTFPCCHGWICHVQCLLKNQSSIFSAFGINEHHESVIYFFSYIDYFIYLNYMVFCGNKLIKICIECIVYMVVASEFIVGR